LDEATRNRKLEAVSRKREAQWAEFEDRRKQSAVDMESYAEGRYPITDRQRSFVRNFIQHWNAARAYEEAGYSGNPVKGVARLFKVPALAAAIQFEQKLAAKKAGLTSEWIMEQMMKILPKYMGEEEVEIPVAFQGELIPNQAKKFHSAEAKGLIEMMAKSTDFFDGGSSPDKQVQVNIDLGSLGRLPLVREAIDHDSGE
jgi:hypothetical protein